MRFLKVLLKIFIVSLILCVILVISSIRPVDRTKYTKSYYYKNTLSQLSHKINNLPEENKEDLWVGAGKAGLTPRIGTPMAGYSARQGAPSIGVHDSLYVRTIIMQSGARLVCILGYDALICPARYARIIEDSVQNRYGLGKEQLLFTATHTHSGPGGWGNGWVEEQFAGPPDSLVQDLFINNSLLAIERALSDRKPASYQYGSIKAPQFVRNRLMKEKGRIDDELVYAAFTRGDEYVAIFVTYSAHATVLSNDNMLFSGDYPGYLENKIESELDAVTIFAAGGVGSHGPRGQGKDYDRAMKIGHGLADSLLLNLEKAGQNTCNLIYFRLPIEVHDPQIRISNDYRLAPWLGHLLIDFEDPYLQVLLLDKLLIFATPADFSGELVLSLKEYAHPKQLRVTLTSFNGCYLGYMTPAEYDTLESYETQLMSFLGPHTGDYFLDIMKKIVDNLSVL